MRAPIVAGQPITGTAIVHGDAAGFMAAILTPGMRAVSITIATDSGAGGFILPNDRVDVILTRKFTQIRSAARRFRNRSVQCARAGGRPDLQAGQGHQDRGRQVRDLELTPGQAEAI